MSKTILIAGGAGFIGTNLCLAALREGHRVVCLDNLSSGTMDNVKMLQQHSNFTFVRHDIARPFDFDTDRLSAIVNLACPASPPFYQSDPIGTINSCVLGGGNLLELSLRHHCRLLQASTSEVYGDPAVSPQSETYWGNVNPIGKRSCYDEGKRCAESLCMAYHNERGADVRIIRIFNTYGPYMRHDDGRVVSNFITQALRGVDLTVYGTGEQTRSLQYIDDLIAAIRLVMRDGIPCQPINIGNPQEISVHALAEKVIALIHSASHISYHPLPADDPCRRCPDISLATRLLDGWQPQVGLDEGLLLTMEYFKNIQKS